MNPVRREEHMKTYILIIFMVGLMSGCNGTKIDTQTDDTVSMYTPSVPQTDDVVPVHTPIPSQTENAVPVYTPVPTQTMQMTDTTPIPTPDTSLYKDVHNKYEKLKSDFKFLYETDYVVQKKELDISKELNIQKAMEISASLYYDKNNELKAIMSDPFFVNPKIVRINIYYQDDDRFVEIRTLYPFDDDMEQETMVYALSNGEFFDISKDYWDDVHEAVAAESESDYNNRTNLVLQTSSDRSYSDYNFMLVSDDYFDWAPWDNFTDRTEWGYWYDKCPFYDLYFMLLDSKGNVLQYFLVDKHILGTGGLIGSGFLDNWNEIPSNAVLLYSSWYAGGGEQYAVTYDKDKQEVSILKRFIDELGQDDVGEPYSEFMELYRIDLNNIDEFVPEDYAYKLRNQCRQAEKLIATYLNAIADETQEKFDSYHGPNGEKLDIFCSGKYPKGGYEVNVWFYTKHKDGVSWALDKSYIFYVDLETDNIYNKNTKE